MRYNRPAPATVTVQPAGHHVCLTLQNVFYVFRRLLADGLRLSTEFVRHVRLRFANPNQIRPSLLDRRDVCMRIRSKPIARLANSHIFQRKNIRAVLASP